ncbi:hypothetical protein BX666DRAFT_1853147 [Dichotomocladium elegans]|nr:hypothetical protein BX666DRAFT_1853147 [Dichotomocladium elegans]
MMDTVASPLFNPEFESMLYALLSTIGFIFTLLIIFVAFLAVRIDELVLWSWAVVWIPLWIIDAVLGYLVCQYLIRAIQNKDDDDDDEDDDAGENDEVKRVQRKAARRRLRIFQQATFAVYWALLVLFQVFIVLRLDHRVGWGSSGVVFIPYFVLEGIHFMLKSVELVLTVVATVGAAKHDQESSPSMLTYIPILIFKQFWFQALRVVLFVLVVLRIDRTITCSWAVVFIPVYLVAVKYGVQLGVSYATYNRLTRTQPELAQQGKMSVVVGAIAFCSVTCCCAGCCLPCMLLISSVGGMDDIEQQQGLVNPNHRITQAGEDPV